MAISFTPLSEGQVITASDLDGNFDEVNDYLDAGIPISDLANESHNICVCIEIGNMTVAGGNKIRGFKVPATFSTGGLKLRELQVYRGGGGEVDTATNLGAVTARLYAAYADAYNNTTAAAHATATIVDDSAAGFATSASTSEAFAAAAALFVRADVATNDAVGVTITLWFVAEHRSAS